MVDKIVVFMFLRDVKQWFDCLMIKVNKLNIIKHL
jgi:hypothetical protein